LVHRQICKDQGIKGYPTTKVYPKGTSKDGIPMKYYKLNAMTLVDTLGAAPVDDANEIDEKEVTEPEKMEIEASPTNLNDRPAFMKRKLNEVFSDAYLSFHTAMKTAVFIDASGTLTKGKQSVLKSWLQTTQRVLPPWKIHALLEALLGGPNREFASVIATEEAFQAILDAHPPRTLEYSAACQLHESPYTCGLWTLFHILTVGVVEFNSAIINTDVSKDMQLNSQVVSKLIRDFVQHFLLCDACVQHFVGEYDACAYSRCKRLGDERHPGTSDDWKELSLWLLETHNGVNVRLQQDRLGTTPATLEQEQQVMWPLATDCPNCWLQTRGASTASRYNHAVMYNYLRLVYW
jgi:Erv1 / Alr family